MFKVNNKDIRTTTVNFEHIIIIIIIITIIIIINNMTY